MATCAGCGEKIVWAISPRGARIPLTKVTAYSLHANEGNPAMDDVAVPLTGVPMPHYVSHFVTCPKRDQFTKKGRDTR
jgi:hypothetical protein